MAQDHSTALSVQAGKLDLLLTSTRHTSENGVAAATSYKQIAKSIETAAEWSQQAKEASEKAQQLSPGVQDRAAKSREQSEKLLAQADNAKVQTLEVLRPRLDAAQHQLETIEDYNSRTADSINVVEAAISKIPANNWKEFSRKAIEKGIETQAMGTQAHDIVTGGKFHPFSNFSTINYYHYNYH